MDKNAQTPAVGNHVMDGKGEEMIVQARIKNVIADMTGVSAAMYGYQDRYRALPGDDANATRWAGAAVGNGNGIIEGTYLAAAGESAEFWGHLRSAGFVAGTGIQQPFNAVSGRMGVQTGDGTGANPGGVLQFAGVAGPPPVPASHGGRAPARLHRGPATGPDSRR